MEHKQLEDNHQRFHERCTIFLLVSFSLDTKRHSIWAYQRIQTIRIYQRLFVLVMV